MGELTFSLLHDFLSLSPHPVINKRKGIVYRVPYFRVMPRSFHNLSNDNSQDKRDNCTVLPSDALVDIADALN